IDRDRDGYPDGDELDAGSDPGNPASTPANVAVGPGRNADALLAIGPNPFRTETELSFTLAQAGPVDLAVFDLMGREVRPVVRGLRLDAGPHRLAWDGRRGDGGQTPAGVYFVRLRTASAEWTRTVVRTR